MPDYLRVIESPSAVYYDTNAAQSVGIKKNQAHPDILFDFRTRSAMFSLYLLPQNDQDIAIEKIVAGFRLKVPDWVLKKHDRLNPNLNELAYLLIDGKKFRKQNIALVQKDARTPSPFANALHHNASAPSAEAISKLVNSLVGEVSPKTIFSRNIPAILKRQYAAGNLENLDEKVIEAYGLK